MSYPAYGHLLELRKCVLKALAFTLILVIGLLPFSASIYSFIAQPLLNLLPANSQMIATQVASPFIAPFKLTLIFSFFLAIPYFFWQLWQFVAPGLYLHEKRRIIPLLLSSIILFYSGITFAYFAVLPIVFKFFTQIAPQGVTVMTDITAYLDFVLGLFLAFGLVFQMPIIVFALTSTGIVNVYTLASKRSYILIGAFFIGMLLTPPDVFSQLLLAIPMYLLFELGLLLAKWKTKSVSPFFNKQAKK